MSVLEFMQHRVCEKLKFRLLHNEQHLLLELLGLLRLPEKRDFTAGGAV